MRSLSSFSIPDFWWRSSFNRKYHRPHTCRIIDRRRISWPLPFQLNQLRDSSGNLLHCSYFNFWFHLDPDCSDRSIVHYSDQPLPTNPTVYILLTQDLSNFLAWLLSTSLTKNRKGSLSFIKSTYIFVSHIFETIILTTNPCTSACRIL